MRTIARMAAAERRKIPRDDAASVERLHASLPIAPTARESRALWAFALTVRSQPSSESGLVTPRPTDIPADVASTQAAILDDFANDRVDQGFTALQQLIDVRLRSALETAANDSADLTVVPDLWWFIPDLDARLQTLPAEVSRPIYTYLANLPQAAHLDLLSG